MHPFKFTLIISAIAFLFTACSDSTSATNGPKYILDEKKQEFISEKMKEMKNSLQKIKNFDFNEIFDKNLNKSEKKGKDLDDEGDEENSSEKTSTQKLYEFQKLKLNNPISEENKNNILTRINDLILEIDSISNSIIEQKEIKDLINEGDIILTSNYSQQVA